MMSMGEVIEKIEYDSFSKAMNRPTIPYATTSIDGKRWLFCPYCGKKQFMLNDNTEIKDMPWKCKGSKCKKEFVINI